MSSYFIQKVHILSNQWSNIFIQKTMAKEITNFTKSCKEFQLFKLQQKTVESFQQSLMTSIHGVKYV